MQLKYARITNYKCVEDSDEFKLDRITNLVGKNETGKTFILYRYCNGKLKEDKKRGHKGIPKRR